MADQEHDEPVSAGEEVSPERVPPPTTHEPQPSAEKPGESPGTDQPMAPAPPAEPGTYWCDEESPGIHPILGQIVHGENDYSGVTHPDSLQAIGELVAAGVLRKA
jgi:hypothetical protein